MAAADKACVASKRKHPLVQWSNISRPRGFVDQPAYVHYGVKRGIATGGVEHQHTFETSVISGEEVKNTFASSALQFDVRSYAAGQSVEVVLRT